MKLLVFQHIDCEHPGMLRTFLRQDDISWDAVELDEGEPIPELSSYDALWVMGGPMDVWDVAENPWLIPEKAAIRHWVQELKKPYLGMCLGHQLLADTLGGTCGPMSPGEIGILDIELTSKGAKDPIFEGMPRKQTCLQWHSVQVAQAPENAVILAKSDICANQAMRIGECAWSMQYHVEVEPDTVDNWAAIPAYKSALDASLGADGVAVMREGAAQNMEDFVANCERLYRNFRSASGI